jgi:ribosomal protein S18 acetylase RimI-like enzyme
VTKEFRGKGYGREIVETILTEAARLGAKNTYLQVDIDNPAALGLYEKLGYREIYRYWYRKKVVHD